MARIVNPLPQLIPLRVAKLRATVAALGWSRSDALDVQGGPVNDTMLSLAQARRQPLRPVRPGEHFGAPRGSWQQRWFRVEVPAARRGEEGRRHLQWDCQGETTAYIDGRPWHGLDLAHRSCPLPDGRTTLWLDASTWQTGLWVGRPGSEIIGPYGLRFDGCRLRIRDELAWQVRWDLEVLEQLLRLLLERDGLASASAIGHQPAFEQCSPLLRTLLRGLDDACDAFAAAGLVRLRDALCELSARLPAEAWQPVAALCGHAHIDAVWLWPEMATERKAVHSFATQLRLLERYPEMVFVQSQPALYRAVERQAPRLMAEIRARIAEGRWEAMGAFEVEPDTNLPSGEALARSLLCGQRKLRDLSGRASAVCWIPDVFGYSNCLPQILRLAGVRYFFTTKMTWSAVTRFPYNSFVWRGADGSEVVAHLCSVGYNGTADLSELDRALRQHRQADVHPEMLLPTGYGDGGGGTAEFMCERARRLANLAGAPRTRWTTTEAFFRRLERARARLPVYQGELYLEYHRGTLTTQSEFKRLYRAAESALQVHEAARVVRGGAPLGDEAWRRVLFCQFHDAIPGSSIALVYAQLNAELAAIAAREMEAARAELARPVARKGGGRAAARAAAVVFNPLPQPRTAVVELERAAAAAVDAPLLQQVGEGAAARWLCAASVAAIEAAPLKSAARAAAHGLETIRHASPRLLDNGLVRAEFDRGGQLVALGVDGREMEIAAPAGLVLYHDEPANFDAWDIDHYSFRTGVPVGRRLPLEVVERGPIRARLRGRARLGERSSVALDYVLEAGARYLRVEASVDWRESHRLLKYHVPTAYRGRWAWFGCPFGAIQRPQSPGVAADEAMWEVAGSRWAAVTRDDGTGLALLTEAKHGFSCRDGDLGLSLLRSAKEPDPTADMGLHRLRFALGRHEPVWRDGVANTAAAADALFAPTVVTRGVARAPRFRLEDVGGLVPSWALPSESGPGFVLRLHETAGGGGQARLRLAAAARSVDLVDLLERRVRALARDGSGAYVLPYRPYEILSVRIRSRI